jgi:O-antigen ligase
MSAIPFIAEKPLLGHGLGSSMNEFEEFVKKTEYRDNKTRAHLHDQYLQILSQTGLLGIIPFLLFLIFFLRDSFGNKEISSLTISILTIFIITSFIDITIRTSMAAFFGFMLAFLQRYKIFSDNEHLSIGHSHHK